jgi:hypothetical protein
MAANGEWSASGLDQQPSEQELAAIGKALEKVGAEFPFTLPLDHPVQAHGETIEQLTLQLPSGGDIFHAGDPFAAGPGQPTNLRALFTLVSRIAGVPESTVKQLSVQDLKTIEFALTPLFAPSVGKLKRIFSILRTSGETSEP